MAGKPQDVEDVRHSAEERGESPDEVLDRNVNELLQEMRVAITGVQILSAFLLTLPFQQRFTTLDTGRSSGSAGRRPWSPSPTGCRWSGWHC